MNWTLTQVAAHVGGRLFGDDRTVTSVSTDTRTLTPGALFFALRGPHFDGHDFAGMTAAAVVERPIAGVSSVVMADPLRALGDLALAWRQSHGGTVVAVTGSNGKTTTKELIAALLGQAHCSRGNLNNLIGMPLSLLAWPRAAQRCVLEMGMSQPGEIARLTEVAAPDVGVITNVGSAHLAGLGSIEGVARAKAELYAGLGRGTAIVNLDDPHVQRLCMREVRGAAITFGRHDDADVCLQGRVPAGTSSRCRIRIQDEVVEVQVPLPGEHNALNACAALAAGLALGVREREFGAMQIPSGRLRVVRARRCTILDDTYNANPASLCRALDVQAELAGGAPRLAVLGDMLELGEQAATLHDDCGRYARDLGADVLALGAHAQALAQGSKNAFSDLDTLLDNLRGRLTGREWVLVKGSRGMRMERVVEALRGMD
jgi:UDP-N-acetylmuramoyl-tripeptide--D-alanyl-D-alanine ligase